MEMVKSIYTHSWHPLQLLGYRNTSILDLFPIKPQCMAPTWCLKTISSSHTSLWGVKQPENAQILVSARQQISIQNVLLLHSLLNKLPNSIQSPQSVSVVKYHLKTHLFNSPTNAFTEGNNLHAHKCIPLVSGANKMKFCAVSFSQSAIAWVIIYLHRMSL